jgi:N-acetyl-anhydromuramyl-L-alanine amidase AmpD
MKRPNSLLAAFLCCASIACSGGGGEAAGPEIVQTPIVFDERREELSLQYMQQRYGMSQDSATIVPRMVVVHWTSIPTFEETFDAFNPSELPQARKAIGSAGALNVSSQFLVDRDGTIHQLLPETTFARHVIGLNHCAIGIENVGNGTNLPLTDAQFASNVALIKMLSGKYPLEYLIGHHEYSKFIGHPLWKESDSGYLTEKSDPGDGFMARLRAELSDLDLKAAPDRDKASGPGLIDER